MGKDPALWHVVRTNQLQHKNIIKIVNLSKFLAIHQLFESDLLSSASFFLQIFDYLLHFFLSQSTASHL